MGLASFNRMRRSRANVEALEAERFKNWNEMHNKRRIAKDELHKRNKELLSGVSDAEAEASKMIAEKNEEGIRRGDDLPLRLDHAAEIAGRVVENPQDPIDPVQHVLNRVGADEVIDEDDLLPSAAGDGEKVAPVGETKNESKPEIVVPDGWADLHWTQQVKLAEDISGKDVVEVDGKSKVIVARELIEAHIANKASDEQTPSDVS